MSKVRRLRPVEEKRTFSTRARRAHRSGSSRRETHSPPGGVGRKPGDHPGNRRDASARSRGCWEAEVGQTHPGRDPRVAARRTVGCPAAARGNRAHEGRAVERLRAPRARPSRKETAATLTRATAGRRRNRCAGLAWHLYGRHAETRLAGESSGAYDQTEGVLGRCSASPLPEAREAVLVKQVNSSRPVLAKRGSTAGRIAADRLEPTTGGACEATENVRGRNGLGQGSSSREGAGGPAPAVPEGRSRRVPSHETLSASPQYAR